MCACILLLSRKPLLCVCVCVQAYHDHYQRMKERIDREQREAEALLESLGLINSSLSKVRTSIHAYTCIPITIIHTYISGPSNLHVSYTDKCMHSYTMHLRIRCYTPILPYIQTRTPICPCIHKLMHPLYPYIHIPILRYIVHPYMVCPCIRTLTCPYIHAPMCS